MLQIFRDHAHKWFIKVLLSVIVISFGLWGIGDIIYKFLMHRPIITVGKHNISPEELAHHLQKETARINEVAKGKLTNQQIKALGIHGNVINRLVSQIVLVDELERMNLGISDELLKDKVHSMPAFQTDGKFDENKFMTALHQQGMNERTFLKEARSSILGQQLLSSISAGAKLPAFYVDSLISALTQEKVFAFVEVDAAKIKLDKTPSQEQLEGFYDQFRNRYMIPEYRNITVVMFDNQAMRKLLGVSDEDIKKFYEERKNDLQYPERRHVKRLTFKEKEQADVALKKLNKNVSFENVAKEASGSESEDMGLVAKEQIIEFAANKIFEVGAGKHTDIIPTEFGFHIFYVTKVEKPRTATFEEAKEELANVLIQEKKSTKIDEIRTKIDDALAAGQKLAEVAKTMNLEVQTIENVNAQGKSEDGTFVLGKQNVMQQEIVEKAFATEQGLDSGFVDVPGKGAFLLCVNKVSPAHSPELTEISEKIAKDWKEEQQLDEASKLAASIASEAKSMSELVSLSTKHNLPLSTNHSFNKLEIMKNDRKSADIFPAHLAEKAFTLAPEVAIAGKNEKGGFTIVMLQKNNPPKATDKEKQNLKNNINSMLQEDIAAATMNAMKEQRDIKINQEMLDQMME